MNDQQVEADLGGEHMEAEKNEVGGEQVGTEQAEDVKIEAEKNETGGEDMEAEDIGMGGGEVENGKVTAVGELVNMWLLTWTPLAKQRKHSLTLKPVSPPWFGG